MKNVRKELQALYMRLKALENKTEQILKALDKLEKAPASGKRKAISKRKTQVRGKVTDKKPVALTAGDEVLHNIKRAKKGLDVRTLIEKSGLEEHKIRSIVSRAYKQGKITRIGRGVYVARKERRKRSRIDSTNLLSYVCIDENKEIVRHGMGRTLNITEEGILLETHVPVEPQHIVSLTIGVKDDLIDIKGRVIYYRTGEDGMFRSGIRFMETDKATLRVLKKFIRAFREH